MSRRSLARLPRYLADRFDQFSDLFLTLHRIAGFDHLYNAARDMFAQNKPLEPMQRRLGGPKLKQNIHAIAVVVHHFLDATHLTFDPFQAL
ncbi:hypothetical protein AD939_01870 [Gluconobacter oxydans]|nr:hypothetical protein AD939_01870 [Gluconobacter oxydans]